MAVGQAAEHPIMAAVAVAAIPEEAVETTPLAAVEVVQLIMEPTRLIRLIIRQVTEVLL
jgi:hypothetical protein